MAKIFVTGDCHCAYTKLGFKSFPESRVLTKDDFVIICGDFGFWDSSPEQDYWMNWLENRPFTTLWVDGNHENFDLLQQLPMLKWNGGKVQYIRPSVIHLMRGQLFTIGGKRFFTFGGARSHDIMDGILDRDDPMLKSKVHRLEGLGASFRINHLSWWEEEMPNEREMSEGLRTLEAADWKTDYIITHCCSSVLQNVVSFGKYESDSLTDYFNIIHDRCNFGHWFFGHYHTSANWSDKETCLYHQIIELTEDGYKGCGLAQRFKYRERVCFKIYVLHGRKEILCRCSTLYPTLTQDWLWRKYYKKNRDLQDNLHTDACIYSPDIIICKTDTDFPERLTAEEWHTVDVISCAAPNLRRELANQYNPETGKHAKLTLDKLYDLHVQRAKSILSTAAVNGVDILITGAFGCGAFANDPHTVAEAWRDAVRDYRKFFSAIEFAVYCRPYETEILRHLKGSSEASMAKINEFTYGQMISAENRRTDTPYTDWRCDFMNCPGIILLYESEHKRPGMGFIHFYPNTGRSMLEDDHIIAFQPAYFHTSIGNISRNDRSIVIDTDNSRYIRYIFEEGDFDLNESDKEFLMLCAGLQKTPEGIENEQETGTHPS